MENNGGNTENNGGKKSNMGCLISVIIAGIILGLLLIGADSAGGGSDYEKAGKEFGTWMQKDPSTWTDTQKDYFNDFWEWSDKN